MKKSWKWLFIGLLIVNIVGSLALAIVLDVFDQPGIHILGNYAHVSVREDCYFIEYEGDKYTASEKSTLLISGYIIDQSFSGYINIDAYPTDPYEHYALNFIGHISKHNQILITNPSINFPDNAELNEYFIRIQKSNPNLIVVNIVKSDGSSVTAVCAESEEEAISNYLTYLDHFYD